MCVIIVETVSSSSGGGLFEVSVRDVAGESNDKVRMPHAYHQKLAQDKTPEEFIKKSFEFLLSRESKESILAEFDLPRISSYFPEYEQEIQKS